MKERHAELGPFTVIRMIGVSFQAREERTAIRSMRSSITICRPILESSFPAKRSGSSASRKKEKGEKWQRNDRLIAVPAGEKRWDDATALERRIQQELEQFFVVVVMMTGKKVRVEGWEGPKSAEAVIQRAVKAYDRGKK
jgi:Inorganic pyrophosphatase